MPRAVDELGQRLTVGPLQGQIVQPIGLSIIVCADDVRMTYPGAVLGFAEKALNRYRILSQPGTQNLHRGHATLRMLGSVDRGGAALADVFGQVISCDGPAGQRVAIHRVAKLVNSAGGSKLNVTLRA